ncbi:MAG: hypothetical protein P4L96_11730 [Rhodoferax sp.]|nr:hypothetical protein [Rhodoferax sp.]
MNSTSSIRIEMQGGLAVVSLAQPARGNPFDGDFTRDFEQVFSDLWDANGLRAVLLRADGANFSFSGDLKAFHPVRDKLAPLDGRSAHGLAACVAAARPHRGGGAGFRHGRRRGAADRLRCRPGR